MIRDDLIAAYAAPNRAYHNLAHVEDCLDKLARVEGLSAAEREILTEAIWWHDVVYDPTRSDNEEFSARLAEQHVAAASRDEVGRLIRLTRTHQVEPCRQIGGDPDLDRPVDPGGGAVALRRLCRGHPQGIRPCA